MAKVSFLSIHRWVSAIFFLLFFALAALCAPSAQTEGSPSLLFSAGTGLPSVLNGSAIVCLPASNYYVQASGSTFFWFGWESALLGGYVLKNFGKSWGISNATGFAGIGLRHIYSTKFFLGNETDATAKFQINNCVDLNFSYVKFWPSGLGWTTGLDLNVSLTHGGLIPQLHVGLALKAL